MTQLNETWKRLWDAIRKLEQSFGDRLVFIGGVAVYLHVKASRLPARFVEFSHDGDFYISLSDFSELRETEQVTSNPRLSKYQLIKNKIDFDIYLERTNALLVPYADVAAKSSVIEGVRVASLEHLLLLKLAAYADRQHSSKGDKDARDLIKITLLLEPRVDLKQLKPYLTEELFSLLDKLSSKKPVFMAFSAGNAHQAKKIRESFLSVVDRVFKAV